MIQEKMETEEKVNEDQKIEYEIIIIPTEGA
jgi:hypothetical protein